MSKEEGLQRLEFQLEVLNGIFNIRDKHKNTFLRVKAVFFNPFDSFLSFSSLI